MHEQSIDLRKHPRVFFAKEDRIEGQIAVAGGAAVLLPVTILSVSEGGISFLCDRDRVRQFSRGTLLIAQADKTSLFGFLQRTECDVRYVLQDPEMPQAIVGCQFRNLDRQAHQEIKMIVKTRQEQSPEEKL